MSEKNKNIFSKIDKSAVLTVLGILLLFASSIGVTLIAPQFIDPSWTAPSSDYQVQMHEIADPNVYINVTPSDSDTPQVVYHLKDNSTLIAFIEDSSTKIISEPNLEKYITKEGDSQIKLTSRVLLLRKPISEVTLEGFVAKSVAKHLEKQLQEKWSIENPDWKGKGLLKPYFEILELYDPEQKEAFSLVETDGVFEHWVDENYEILDGPNQAKTQNDSGFLYVKNPQEYRISLQKKGASEKWKYDPKGKSVASIEELTSPKLEFMSRKALIDLGEHIYATEGCWYCHTDQSRTLVQDSVLNGSANFPAPPSSANEYIYNKITFPGTRRIGPDIARVGIKRPSRDWHRVHFWTPKLATAGSIMPAYRHFFDKISQDASKEVYQPNYQFEAIFQYLMTKGTRITPPNQAWWRGEDPAQIIRVINGTKRASNKHENK